MSNMFNRIGGYRQFLNWDGKENKTNPYTHPYSYEPYIIYKKNNKYEHCVYSDRLYQWDWKKHDNLCKKHFGDEGQYWDNRNKEKIEAFLQDYYEKPELQLVGIMTGCNVSDGYPYWIFMFNCKF